MSTVEAEPTNSTGQPWGKAMWASLGLGLLAALIIVVVADWTALWIAAVVAVAAFPVFLGANIVTAKYSSSTGEQLPPEEDR